MLKGAAEEVSNCSQSQLQPCAQAGEGTCQTLNFNHLLGLHDNQQRGVQRGAIRGVLTRA